MPARVDSGDRAATWMVRGRSRGAAARIVRLVGSSPRGAGKRHDASAAPRGTVSEPTGKDVLDWLKTRSHRVRARRTLDFVEFCKCFAGIFHDPKAPELEGDARHKKLRDEAALFADEAAVAAEWARTLGRKKLLELERAFKRRCAPHVAARGQAATLGQARLGLPARDVRQVFRDVGVDVAPSKLARCLRDSGVGADDFLSFPETVGAFHALFIKDGAVDADDATSAGAALMRPPSRSVEGGGADGPLRPVAEVAAVVFAEQRWEGTPLQHACLVRRLCVGRPASVQEAIRRVRDKFEELDTEEEGQLAAAEADKLLDAAGVKGHKELRDDVLKVFKEKPDKPADKKKKRRHTAEAKSDDEEAKDDVDGAKRDRSRSPRSKRDRSPESKKKSPRDRADAKDDASEPRGPPPFSLAEFFATAGHVIEAAGEDGATVSAAFAKLRLSCTPAEVRAAAQLVATLLQNAIDKGNPTFWRVATDNATFGRPRGYFCR